MTTDPGRADGVEHSDLDDAMADFLERARVSNGARAEVIARALQALLDGDLPEDMRLHARAAAHSLAGSAGTFGFPLASRLGRDLEALFDTIDTIDADPQARARAGLEQVALLRQALADPADPADPDAPPRNGGGEASHG
jgi:chemotaxis protein histidine kinase CheA